MTWGDRVHGRVGVKKLWMAQKVVKEKKLALTKGGAQCIGRRTFLLISHGIKINFFALIIKNEVILQ